MAFYLCSYRATAQFKALDHDARVAKNDRLWQAMSATHPASKHNCGWYGFPGEQAGVVLIEAASAQEVDAIVQPWGETLDWTVKEVMIIDYREVDAEVAARAATRS